MNVFSPPIKLTDGSPEHDDFHVRNLVFLGHAIFPGVLVTNPEIPCSHLYQWKYIVIIFVQLQNSLDLYFHEVGKLSTMKWHSV